MMDTENRINDIDRRLKAIEGISLSFQNALADKGFTKTAVACGRAQLDAGGEFQLTISGSTAKSVALVGMTDAATSPTFPYLVEMIAGASQDGYDIYIVGDANAIVNYAVILNPDFYGDNT